MFTTAVIVAEIKSFYSQGYILENSRASNYTEPIHNESLAGKSGRFLDLVSSIVHKYGGDII
jgi:hypothetical protein